VDVDGAQALLPVRVGDGLAVAGVEPADVASGHVRAGLLQRLLDAILHALDVLEVVVLSSGVGVDGLVIFADVRAQLDGGLGVGGRDLRLDVVHRGRRLLERLLNRLDGQLLILNVSLELVQHTKGGKGDARHDSEAEEHHGEVLPETIVVRHDRAHLDPGNIDGGLVLTHVSRSTR